MYFEFHWATLVLMGLGCFAAGIILVCATIDTSKENWDH